MLIAGRCEIRNCSGFDGRGHSVVRLPQKAEFTEIRNRDCAVGSQETVRRSRIRFSSLSPQNDFAHVEAKIT
jgi:hypothetical protein